MLVEGRKHLLRDDVPHCTTEGRANSLSRKLKIYLNEEHRRLSLNLTVQIGFMYVIITRCSGTTGFRVHGSSVWAFSVK